MWLMIPSSCILSSAVYLPFREIAPSYLFFICIIFMSKFLSLSHFSVFQITGCFSPLLIELVACKFWSFLHLIKILILVSCLGSCCRVFCLLAAIGTSLHEQPFIFPFGPYTFQLFSYQQGNPGTYLQVLFSE